MLTWEVHVGVEQLQDEIEQLPVDEQLRLLRVIWDRLAAEPRAVPVAPAHLEELRQRLAEHDEAPDDVVSWEDLKDEFGS